MELIQEEGDCTVTGSYLLLYRAVYNLVENAIKYNQSVQRIVSRSYREGPQIDEKVVRSDS